MSCTVRGTGNTPGYLQNINKNKNNYSYCNNNKNTDNNINNNRKEIIF